MAVCIATVRMSIILQLSRAIKTNLDSNINIMGHCFCCYKTQIAGLERTACCKKTFEKVCLESWVISPTKCVIVEQKKTQIVRKCFPSCGRRCFFMTFLWRLINHNRFTFSSYYVIIIQCMAIVYEQYSIAMPHS